MQLTLSNTRSRPSVPGRVYRSPLCRQGGFGVYEGILDANLHNLLWTEARTALPTAEENLFPESESDGWAGNPARKLLSARGGSAQTALYHADWLHQWLRQLTGADVTPSGPLASYSYYARPGDYIALHKDVDWCNLTVLACLYDNGVDASENCGLTVYPGQYEAFADGRLDRTGGHRIQLRPGRTLVMLGGLVPHEVRPVVGDQMRVVSVMCFEV